MLLLALAFALLPVLGRLPGVIAHRDEPPLWNGTDQDVTLLRLGLLQAPHFRDTLRWWTGPWVGFLPYWRPLTSYLFWFEWKGFGEREWLFAFPAMAAHLAAAVLFALFVHRLAQARRIPAPGVATAVAAWGYAFGFPGVLFHHRLMVNAEVFVLWKNQPDAWTAICGFASLLCYLKAQQGSRAGLAGAVAWFVTGCGFKELTIPLFGVYCALELPFLGRGPRAPAARRLALMFLVAAGMAAWRSYCVHTVWYRYASNGAWFPRTLTELLGPFGAAAVAGDWLGNALGLWSLLVVGTAIRTWRHGECGMRNAECGIAGPDTPQSAIRIPHSHRPVIAWVAGGAILAGWCLFGSLAYARAFDIPWPATLNLDGLITSFLASLQPEDLVVALGTITWLLAFRVLARHDWTLAALGLAWTAAFLALYTFSPGNIYRYYLSQDGYILVIALAAGCLAKAVGSRQ